MNSNEEYLDSLLKAVTTGQGMETDIDVSDKNTESDIDNEFILDAPEWDEDEETSNSSMLDAIADLDSLTAENNMQESSSEEEKAFSDPGALFFEGEEETEDDLFIGDTGDDAQPVDGNVSDVMDVEDILFSDDALSEADQKTEEDAFGTDEGMNQTILEDNAAGAEAGLEEQPDETLESEEKAVLKDTGDAAPVEVAEELGSNEENEEELEDLILAADSIEEVMEPGDDEFGFQEISDLLANAGDSDEEMLAMLGGVGEADEGLGDIGFFDDEPEDASEEEQVDAKEEDTGKKKKAKKEKKSKKGKKADETDAAEEIGENQEETEGQEKKQGIFARFMNFLLEEDEEDEVKDGDNQEASIDELLMGEASDENAAILAEIDKENEDKKSAKKDKKKGKKGKKGKTQEAAGEDGEEDEEDQAEEKSKKAKKVKKKKEKKEKEEVLPEKPDKKISPRKIQATALFCLTLTAAIILIVHLIPPALEKEKARDAYYDRDYVKVVEGFYGEELNESDELMYNRAVTILKFKRKVDAYNNYMHMGKETEALNQLIEAINRYEEIYDDAVTYNIIGEIDAMYQTVLDALQNRYGLSIARAMEIYAIEDDFEYTLMLESIIDGIEYQMPETAAENPEASAEGEPEMIPEVPAEGQSDMLSEGAQPAEEQGEVPEEIPVE